MELIVTLLLLWMVIFADRVDVWLLFMPAGRGHGAEFCVGRLNRWRVGWLVDADSCGKP